MAVVTDVDEVESYKRALKQRRDYLSKRIEAKLEMVPPWDTRWDVRERDATAWALVVIEAYDAS